MPKIIKNQQILVFVTIPSTNFLIFDPKVYFSVNYLIVRTTVCEEMRQFWIWKKKKNAAFFFSLSSTFHFIRKSRVKWKVEESEQKKKQHFFFFQIQNCLIFSQTLSNKQSYNHKIYREYTLGSKLKICQRNCHKNQH